MGVEVVRSQCKDECIEIQKIRSKVNVVGWLLGILLGVLLALNGAIFLNVSTMSSHIATTMADYNNLKARLDIHQNSIDYLNKKHMDGNHINDVP